MKKLVLLVASVLIPPAALADCDFDGFSYPEKTYSRQKEEIFYCEGNAWSKFSLSPKSKKGCLGGHKARVPVDAILIAANPGEFQICFDAGKDFHWKRIHLDKSEATKKSEN